VQLTGAQALVRSLEEQGVEVVFGLPGGAILPAYDPLLSSSLRHILVRHEQGAGHAAEGYAWATGRTGVCIATSGPGATNLVTALADAYMDSVPMVAIVGALSGAIAGGVLLGRERDAGLLARFWVLPVHRASGMASRIIAEGCRIVLGTIAVVLVGFVLGFRFHQGLPSAVGFLLVPVLFGLAFATIVTAVAVFTAKATLVEGITIVTSLMMFFSTGFVPLIAFPRWIQPVVRNQPMSVAVDTMRALSEGGQLARPLTLTVIWSLAAILVFSVPAALGYRRASRR